MRSIYHKAAIMYLGLSFLWCIPSCSSVRYSQSKDAGNSIQQEKAHVRIKERSNPKYPSGFYMTGEDYSDQGSSEAYVEAKGEMLKARAWEEGVEDLVLQVLRRLPVDGPLTVRVGEFSEGKGGDKITLSELIESDIRIT